MEFFTQENKTYANYTDWLPWKWAPVKFMVNEILQVPSALYSFLPQAVDDKEPLALYAYRTDPGYRQYKDWCFKVRQMLGELKQDVRYIDASRKKRVMTPSLTEILLEKQQYHTNEVIVSSLYYDQQLADFERKIIKKWKLSKTYVDEIAEVRAQLKIQLKNQPEQALEHFYQDTINLIIQKSGQLDSLEEELKALVYYQNLVPNECYQAVTNCIQDVIKQYSYSEENNNNRYMPSFREHNRFYKNLLQQVNLVFREYRQSEPMEKIENDVQYSKEAKEILHKTTSLPLLKIITTTLATTASLTALTYTQSYPVAHWDSSFSPTASLWNCRIPPLIWISPLAFTYSNHRISAIYSTWVAAPIAGLILEWLPSCLADSRRYPTSFDLSALNSMGGFVIHDPMKDAGAGWDIDIGDINGDNITDIFIGAPGASPSNKTWAGASYIVFGRTDAFNASLELSALNGHNGFVINGLTAGDQLGVSIARGDFNDDGIDDILIGAGNASPENRLKSGASYVVFGRTDAFNASLELSALNGHNGFTINGVTAGDRLGFSVASGDINGDGIDDILIGAFRASPGNRSKAGASYVVFGRTDAFNASLELSALNGHNGFTINGVTAGDQSGVSVASGDVNGDGIDDVLIGAPNASSGTIALAGASYVVFGRTDAFNASLELSALNGHNGYVINGITPIEESGTSIACGDINGDHTADILIGAPNASPNDKKFAGASYIVFGRTDAFNASLKLSTLNGHNGFMINGVAAGDQSGIFIANSDINNDGFADILIGAFTASPNKKISSGASYIVFGHNDIFNASLELSTLNGHNGFVLNGANANDCSGKAIACGDINGDHTADILIGAPGNDGNSIGGASACYVVFTQRIPIPKDEGIPIWLIISIVGCSVAALSLLGGSLIYYYKKRQRQDKELDDISSERNPLLKHEQFYVPVGNYHVYTKITLAHAEGLYKQAGIKVPFQESETSAKFSLGKGQFGEVLIALQRKTKEYLACKIIRGGDAIRASKHEAKLQQKLKNKPHIMPLIDSIETKDDQHNPVLYQFLPLAGFGNGKTLKKALAQQSDLQMKNKVIVHVAKSLLIALQNAHNMHMYHLDIKPKNFVMNQKGHVYLIDFGCMVETALTSAMITPVYNEQGKPISGGGDFRYFSPERLEAINTNKPFDGEKADVWALGVTLLELAMNRNPFNQENLQDVEQVQHFLNNIFQNKDTRPSSFWSVIQALLEPNPEERLRIQEVLEMPIFKRKNPNITFSSEQEQEGVFSLLQDLIATKSSQVGQSILNIQGSEPNESSSPSKFFSTSPPSHLLFKPASPVKSSHYGVSIQVHDEVQNESNITMKDDSSFEI